MTSQHYIRTTCHISRLALFLFALTALPVAIRGEQAQPPPAPAGEATPAAAQADSAAEAGSELPEKQAETPASASPSHSPTASVTINLIRAMVAKNLLTQEEADAMIRQAEREAEIEKARMQAEMLAIAQAAAAQAAAEQMELAAPSTQPLEEGEFAVSYIPAPVRDRIKEEIKADLLTETGGDLAGLEKKIPEWTKRIRLFGDLRLRYEAFTFPDGNDSTGSFPNFNAINTGRPYDITGFQFAPQYNTNEDRNRFRMRARLGLEAILSEVWTAGFRVATGNDGSPVSTNQTLGASGGQFSKYAIWLDRAFLKAELGEPRDRGLTATFGRFENPFFSTPLIWDDDLGFDGFAATARWSLWEPGSKPNIKLFVTGGAFPVYNTSFDFSSNQPLKYPSRDKYLIGGQAGIEFDLSEKLKAKFAAAYYAFENIEGVPSTPYTPLSDSDESDTDISRPSFAQHGNTYRAIRRILPDFSNDFGATNQWQYFGLASKFEELALTGRIDYNGFEPVQLSLIGEWVRNLRFDRDAIEAVAINNRGPDNDELDETLGLFEGDDTGWIAELRVGTPEKRKLGDWHLAVNYRYIGSDAVVDGFNDSDFGFGGTNAEGYTISGGFAIAPEVWLGLRYISTQNIAGPPLKTDIIQLDLNAKF